MIMPGKMETIICNSINHQKLLKIEYNKGPERIIEPYAYGMDRYGFKLSAYQISGYSKSGNVTGWKLFKNELIDCILVLDKHFQIRADYNPDDNQIIPVATCKI